MLKMNAMQEYVIIVAGGKGLRINITQFKVGYLLNFGEERDYKRIINNKSPL